MFNVIAISTVQFRLNCVKTKINTTEGQHIVDVLRERIDHTARIELNIVGQGPGWITVQYGDDQITFSEHDQTLEDQLCASVASAWLGRNNWPDQYQEAIVEMEDKKALDALDELSLDADFQKVFMILAAARRKQRLYPQLKIVD